MEEGRIVEAPAAPEVPGWRVGEPIAAGGQAAVWRVTRAGDGATCALKVGHGRGAGVSAALADEAAAQQVIGASTVSGEGAPVVAAHVADGALADGRPYLIMELVGGGTLGGALERARDPLPLDEVLVWGRGVAAALVALHGAGWIHRDLKPDNLARDAAGRVRLLDLGLAVRAGDALAAGGAMIAGTALYMAPEQLRGGAVDPRTDLYALGAVLFEALTLRPPFAGDRAAIELGHLAFRPPRLSSLRAVPRALDELVAACLAKAPADRPESAAAVLTALVAIDPDGAERVTSARAEAPTARSRVALVAVEGVPPGWNLDHEVRRRGGIIARQVGARVVLAFLPDEHAAPLPAALALARSVAAAGGRAVVHVAEVLVRRARGRTALYGAPIERPVEWMPTATFAVALTAAASRELDDAELVPLPDASEHVTLRGVSAIAAPATTVSPPSLLGRDALIGEAMTGARAALDRGPPGLWVALGGAGSGKSRLAAALADAVVALVSDAAVIRIEGHRSFGASAGAAAAELLARLGAPSPSSPASSPSPSPSPLTVQIRAALDEALARGPVAIVIDDAQWIDATVLDGLATAVRAGDGPLWVALVAADTIADARPAWLDGARVTLATLAALDDSDAATLLRRLLAPARRIPEPLVARLAARTGGVPGVIAALARELVRAGLVRRHPGSDVWYLAADELDFLPPAPGVHWFVSRRLAALSPGLAELARVCALLGPRFTLAEVVAAADVPAAGVTIDPAIGLARLGASGLVSVRPEPGNAYTFRSEAEQEAIAQNLPEPVRVAVHRAVLAHLRDDAHASDRAAELAYHAARAGETEFALDHLEHLSAAAGARLAHLETARWLTVALDLAGGAATPRRRRLLTERGRARRMLTQYDEAASDLREARALAQAEGATDALVDILVIETAVADFTEQLGEAVRAIEQAAATAPASLPDPIRARLHNWLGVVRARQERLGEARAELERAIDLAERTGDHDTAIGSMLMLGGVLRRLGLVDDGRAVLDRVIVLCERTGDHFHLAAAHFNRINVWRRLGEPARAEADAAAAIAIANRMGIDQLELWGWYNLSELRWWTGDLEGALAAAEVSHRIGVERFRARPPVIGTLWYALLLAAAGEIGSAARLLDQVRGDEVGHNPWLALVRDAARLAVDGDLGPAWEPLVVRAGRAGAEEDAVIVHWTRARTARRAGDEAATVAATAAAAAAAATLGRAVPPVAWPGEGLDDGRGPFGSR